MWTMPAYEPVAGADDAVPAARSSWTSFHVVGTVVGVLVVALMIGAVIYGAPGCNLANDALLSPSPRHAGAHPTPRGTHIVPAPPGAPAPRSVVASSLAPPRDRAQWRQCSRQCVSEGSPHFLQSASQPYVRADTSPLGGTGINGADRGDQRRPSERAHARHAQSQVRPALDAEDPDRYCSSVLRGGSVSPPPPSLCYRLDYIADNDNCPAAQL